jgi:hypothetical protein
MHPKIGEVTLNYPLKKPESVTITLSIEDAENLMILCRGLSGTGDDLEFNRGSLSRTRNLRASSSRFYFSLVEHIGLK